MLNHPRATGQWITISTRGANTVHPNHIQMVVRSAPKQMLTVSARKTRSLVVSCPDWTMFVLPAAQREAI
jgi:hypothetical protein